jgi:hypothetical protein
MDICMDMRSLDLDDMTFKRLSTIRADLMESKKKDMEYDDVINQLIDSFQENTWGHLGAEAAGG